jgi:hypothetical protein
VEKMTLVQESFVTQLAGYAPLFSLIGENISPLQLEEQSPLPAISYLTLPDVGVFSHSGPGGLSAYHMQVDCYAASYIGALNVAKQVAAALANWNIGAEYSIQDDPSEPVTMPGRYRVIVDISFML